MGRGRKVFLMLFCTWSFILGLTTAVVIGDAGALGKALIIAQSDGVTLLVMSSITCLVAVIAAVVVLKTKREGTHGTAESYT